MPLSRTLLLTTALLGFLPVLTAQTAATTTAPTHEPRNAAEAQLQNKYADKIKPALYQKWADRVQAASAEEQVWLHTLEDQLGGFYFPHYVTDLFGPKPYDAAEDAWAYVQDDPALPRVLIIGDSISRAYTATVRQTLKGKANVHRAPANCGPTARFLEFGEIWLNQNGTNNWDYIVVNFGIHDGKNPKGYEERLRQVFTRLKGTGAKKIFWVRTTPWGKDTAVFENPDADASQITNPTSDRVAAEAGLDVIDAHALLKPLISKGLNRKDCTHWTPEVYTLLGNAVAGALAPALSPPAATTLKINATSTPNEPNGTRYKPGLWLVTQRQNVDAMKGACDLIFIGDSITFGWDGQLWKQYFAPRRALNYGIPGDTLENVLYRLDYPGLQELQPKVAVILIGTNNSGAATDTAKGILSVVNKTRTLFPSAKIVLMDLLPTARRTGLVTEVNSLIQGYADNKTVFRLNLGERMTPEGDSWIGLGPDKLHLTSSGYKIWQEMLEPLLVQFMGPAL